MTLPVGVGGMYAEPQDMTRAQRRSAAALAAEQAPQRMREHLGSSDNVDTLCRVILQDVADPDSKGHRTAMMLQAQILRAVGAESDLVAAFLAGLGVQSREQLGAFVESARGSSGATIEQVDQQALQHLARRFRQDPALRAQGHAILFGGEVSAAVVVEAAKGPAGDD